MSEQCPKCKAKDEEIARLNSLLEEIPKEVCICAAVRIDNRIFMGHRHHNCFAAMIEAGIPQSVGKIQGFMTTRNRFVDRFEGLQLQIAAGIISADKDGYHESCLMSEDLY